MSKKKVNIMIILSMIAVSPFIGIFTIHQFIGHPDHWKKTIAFFKGAKYLGDDGIILQTYSHDCGPACLKIIFDYFEIPTTLEEISEKVLDEKGSNMLCLKRLAELKGLKSEGWRFLFKDLKKMKLPAIALVNRNHYVVISKITEDDKIIVLDPAIGKLKYSSRRFQRIWKGESLIFSLN